MCALATYDASSTQGADCAFSFSFELATLDMVLHVEAFALRSQRVWQKALVKLCQVVLTFTASSNGPCERHARASVEPISSFCRSVMSPSIPPETNIPITVFTGFLGAGKTSIILSLLPQLPKDYKVVLLKNEFGDLEGIYSRFHF